MLATVASSTLPADERLTLFRDGQFAMLQRPYNQVSGVAHAHLHAVLRALRDRDDIDLVHDHVEVVGLAVLAAAALAPAPRRCCTPCTGTWPSTRTSTPASTPGRGSGSTACRRRSSARAPDGAAQALAGTCAPGHAAGGRRRPAAARRRRRPRRRDGPDHAGQGPAPGRPPCPRVRFRPDPGRAGRTLPAARGPGRGRRCTRPPTPTSATGRTRCARWSTASGCAGSVPWRAGSGIPGGVRAGRPVSAAMGRARRDGGGRDAGARHSGGRAVPRLPAGTRGARAHRVAGRRRRRISRRWSRRPSEIDVQECREQAARRFTPAVMAARYAKLYEQLISGKGGDRAAGAVDGDRQPRPFG